MRRGMNSMEMQKNNRILVLKTLQEKGMMTRAELAVELNLQKATITNIINEFYEMGIVEVIGESAAGRRGEKLNLKLDDILYFERDKRVTYVVTMEKEYTVDDKIQEIEERIAREDFVRCHTSFLVNFSYVKECTKKKMLLENGKIVDVSRSYWKKTEDAYVEWVKRWAR